VVANISGSRFGFPIRAVAFDLDDTLFDRGAALEVLLEKWTGGRIDPRRVVELNLLPRRELFVELAHVLSCGNDADKVERRFRAEFPSCVKRDPEVIAVLDGLRASGVPLGLLSNGAPGMQLAKLRACGAAPYFPPRRTLISGAIGMEKPDPRAFRLLAARLNVEPGEILFVGDDPVRDIAGAASAGMIACQLLRSGRERAAGVPVIESLVELPQLMNAHA
jgi:HAD superfamily hydrolase (TIGR01509 family)